MTEYKNSLSAKDFFVFMDKMKFETSKDCPSDGQKALTSARLIPESLATN